MQRIKRKMKWVSFMSQPQVFTMILGLDIIIMRLVKHKLSQTAGCLSLNKRSFN